MGRAPQSFDKQSLLAQFFVLPTPLVDPYTDAASEARETVLEEEKCDLRSSFDEYDSDDCMTDDYDDRWEELADRLELAMQTPRKHLSRARLELERTAGPQRHLHVSAHQVRRAELKTAQRQTAIALRRARIEAPNVHCDTAPAAIAPSYRPAPHRSYTQHSYSAPRRSNWGTGPSIGGWEPAPTATAAAVVHTSTGRRVQLSREEQEVAAAIQASLVADSNAAGGLSMEQIAELLTRDLSPNDYEMLLRLDESVQKKTLSTEAIGKLPTRTVTKDDLTVKCTICQCEYEEGETLQTTPCQHTFHADCLQTWLTKSSTKCALCNASLE